MSEQIELTPAEEYGIMAFEVRAMGVDPKDAFRSLDVSKALDFVKELADHWGADGPVSVAWLNGHGFVIKRLIDVLQGTLDQRIADWEALDEWIDGDAFAALINEGEDAS